MTTSSPEGKARNFAALKNVAALAGLIAKLQSLSVHQDRMGVFYGFSGWGKSRACRYAKIKYNAAYVEVRDTWTRKYLLLAILRELGVQAPRGTLASLEEHAILLLGEDINRPLIIDEADKLVDRGMIELVRSIYDGSNAPVVLVGEEALPTKLNRIERVARRVQNTVAAVPCDLADTRKLAEAFYPALALDDALLERLRSETKGNAARIVSSLDHVNEWARNAGTRTVTASIYTGTIQTGEQPVPRTSTGAVLPLRRRAS